MFSDGTISALSEAMDASSLRHQVIAGNIANARTPGYRPSDVSFSARVAHLRSEGTEASAPDPGVAAREGTRFNGVSFVDVQQETAQMTSNAIHYQSLAQLATARLHLLASVAHEGRR